MKIIIPVDAGFEITKFYVAPAGNDRWSGKMPGQVKSTTNGPFATVRRAQEAIRGLRKKKGGLKFPVQVFLRGGNYFLKEPLVFTPEDSGSLYERHGPRQDLAPDCLVEYLAYPGEKPIISGGRKIAGWKHAQINGHKAWAVFLPEVKSGKWFFTQLWVNGRRAPRPRLPEKGEFSIAALPPPKPASGLFAGHGGGLFDSHDCFEFRAGEIKNWKNIRDIEFVALTAWLEQRIPVRSIDFKKRIVNLAAGSNMQLMEAPYYLENIFDELHKPGQWYLDRTSGMLYYLPLPGENPATTEVIAPALDALLRLEGRRQKNQPAQLLYFKGLTLAHSEWRQKAPSQVNRQAGYDIPGMIRLEYAAHCAFENCRIIHSGAYGIDLGDGCHDNVIRWNTITDLAAGGIKVQHGCKRTLIADNEISHGGIRYHQAVGVLIGRSSGNKVLHNHIHNFDYTGLSVGWTWGYGENEADGNVIEYNHIHDIGRKMLSDLGGIYTLGVSPGTRIRYNLVHDISARCGNAQGIYLDEGSSEILIENNLVYQTEMTLICLHYGGNNIIRNNIFAYGGRANSQAIPQQIGLGYPEHHLSYSFTRNIVYIDTGRLFVYDWKKSFRYNFDNNIYWDASGRNLDFAGKSFRQWQAQGLDKHSRIADPLFRNPVKRDFRLSKNSPAMSVGFMPFDLSTVGPRLYDPDIIEYKPEYPLAATDFVSRILVSRSIPGGGDLASIEYPLRRQELAFQAHQFPQEHGPLMRTPVVFCDIRQNPFKGKGIDDYAFFTSIIHCPEAMKLRVGLGYDGPVKVWIDKKLHFHDPRGTNPAFPDKAKIIFQAKKGRHEIMLALSSNSGKAWGIFLRFIRPDVSRQKILLGPGAYRLPQVIKC